MLRTIILQHGVRYVNINSLQVLNCLNDLIYKKILKLSSSSKKYLEAGQIMNNISVDVNAFYSFIVMNAFAISAPLMILIGVILLLWEVGWIGIVAPFIFGIGIYIQQKLLSKSS